NSMGSKRKWEVPLEIWDARADVPVHEGERLIDGLRHSQRLRAQADGLVEAAQRGVTPAQERTSKQSGRAGLAESLGRSCSRQRRHDLLMELDGFREAAHAQREDPEEESLHHHPQVFVSRRGGQLDRLVTACDRLVLTAW